MLGAVLKRLLRDTEERKLGVARQPGLAAGDAEGLPRAGGAGGSLRWTW